MAEKEEKTEVAMREEEVLAFWNANSIFEKSVEREPKHGEYTFYDGPPFATGEPHYGHIVASAIKDAIPRYWTMKGYRVKRQWGWDCHGLPIENIVEKELGTKTKKDIIRLGVKKFNDLCRERIFTYIGVWEQAIPRFGRWADMSKPYRTMDTSFMESDWWAFKTLYDKGLIYEDYRIMYICPRCETTLSQSEVAEGYKDIKDLAVTVEFELIDEPGTFVLAWTTTPWTLPGNVALAVGKDIQYVTIEKKDEDSGKPIRFIVAKDRLEATFPNSEYSIVKTYSGSELIGKHYKPLFDYFSNNADLKNRENGWKIYAADFVTAESGTGIAHEAPAFGADDWELSKKENLPFVQHVGMDGVFTKEVTDFEGLHVKPIDDVQGTDVAIIKYLAAHSLLFAKEKYEHSYPHCWRCDTPLLNYATSSWFVGVTKIKDRLLKLAEDINWSPAHIKEGRWGQWLLGARDWSISRQRFWATTIPLWRCEDCKKEKVFGSIKELEEASGVLVDDLHKDVVDEVTCTCDCGGVMHRIPDVLDTWFDSGSVPYAALHYPFENEDEFKKRLPVDFIAEGQDQTRTWFYYQHVLSGGLFDSRAFNNVVVNGLVLAEDGKKMSKRLKNYPDPMEVVNTYGADAIRLYMLSSPIVAADNLAFAERGVDEWMKKVIQRLENVYQFLALYGEEEIKASDASNHVLDRWIVARTRELAREVTTNMDAYSLDAAVRPFMQYVDDLSTWYLRRSRDRLRDEGEEGQKARATLRFALRSLSQLLAPFAPFMTDWLWMRLKETGDAESVHLEMWPEIGNHSIDVDVLDNMKAARAIVSQALEQRERAGIKVRQVLQSLTVGVILPDDVRTVIAEEINVKEIITNESQGDGVLLDTTLTKELEVEGHARDIVRMIQEERGNSNFDPRASSIASISGGIETESAIEKYGDYIKRATRSTALHYKPAEEVKVHVEETT